VPSRLKQARPPAVLKYLLEHQLIDGSTMTVTGKTLAENLESAASLPPGQDIIRPLDQPIKSSGHIRCAPAGHHSARRPRLTVRTASSRAPSRPARASCDYLCRGHRVDADRLAPSPRSPARRASGSKARPASSRPRTPSSRPSNRAPFKRARRRCVPGIACLEGGSAKPRHTGRRPQVSRPEGRTGHARDAQGASTPGALARVWYPIPSSHSPRR
jgi:hypothetical protein